MEAFDDGQIDKVFLDATVEVLGVEALLVTNDASFKDDLDSDSLDLVEFVMMLEEDLNITIPEEHLDGIDRVGKAKKVARNILRSLELYDGDIDPEADKPEDDDPEGGVREPRNPLPNAPAGSATVDIQ